MIEDSGGEGMHQSPFFLFSQKILSESCTLGECEGWRWKTNLKMLCPIRTHLKWHWNWRASRSGHGIIIQQQQALDNLKGHQVNSFLQITPKRGWGNLLKTNELWNYTHGKKYGSSQHVWVTLSQKRRTTSPRGLFAVLFLFSTQRKRKKLFTDDKTTPFLTFWLVSAPSHITSDYLE